MAPVIKSMNLSGNTLKSIPIQLNFFVVLKTLRLSRCYMQRSHDNMIDLPNLTTLHLDFNDFEETTLHPLPRNTVHLDLTSNHFREVPLMALGHLTRLVELKLSKNRLTSLLGIEVLVHLESLFLDENKLTGLSNVLGALKRLRTLSVRNNSIGSRDPAQADGDDDGPLPQSIHAHVFTETNLINIELEGNTVQRSEVMAMDGVDVFMKRRKLAKDKSFSGGATTDLSVFGLD